MANARREGSIYILEDKNYEILSAYGFRTVKRVLATSEDECIKVAKEIGYPIVIEITTIMRIKKVNFLLEKSINIISSSAISKTIS